MEARIEKFREILHSQPFEALMILVAENRRYLAGFTGEDTQCDESAGCLFITCDKVLLATDSRYTTQAENECPFAQVYLYKNGLAKSLPEICGILGVTKLGFEMVRLSYFQYQRLMDGIEQSGADIELIPSFGLVEGMRVIKDRSEIEAMRKALRVAEKVITDLVPRLSPGMTENQAAWELEKGIRDSGGDSLAFPTIVASGPNSALPHAGVTDKIIEKGEPLLFDWGAKINGYCSDISRTLVLGEPADEKFKKIFETVKKAQQLATEKIRPGVNSREVDRAAREYIAEQGFQGKFGHGLGHGVGLAVHEDPRIGPQTNTDLVPGMVFTVEPGIYLPEYGGVRLENMVAVTEDGVEVLNSIGQFYNS